MSDIGKSILQGASDALAFKRGDRARGTESVVEIPAEVDVKAIRKNLRLSQSVFAKAFGFKLGTLRDWEQGRRQPDASARVLLTVIAREPEAVQRALRPTAIAIDMTEDRWRAVLTAKKIQLDQETLPKEQEAPLPAKAKPVPKVPRDPR